MKDDSKNYEVKSNRWFTISGDDLVKKNVTASISDYDGLNEIGAYQIRCFKETPRSGELLDLTNFNSTNYTGGDKFFGTLNDTGLYIQYDANAPSEFLTIHRTIGGTKDPISVDSGEYKYCYVAGYMVSYWYRKIQC